MRVKQEKRIRHPDGRSYIVGCYSEVAARLFAWSFAVKDRVKASRIYRVATRIEMRYRKIHRIRESFEEPKISRPPPPPPPVPRGRKKV